MSKDKKIPSLTQVGQFSSRAGKGHFHSDCMQFIIEHMKEADIFFQSMNLMKTEKYAGINQINIRMLSRNLLIELLEIKELPETAQDALIRNVLMRYLLGYTISESVSAIQRSECFEKLKSIENDFWKYFTPNYFWQIELSVYTYGALQNLHEFSLWGVPARKLRIPNNKSLELVLGDMLYLRPRNYLFQPTKSIPLNERLRLQAEIHTVAEIPNPFDSYQELTPVPDKSLTLYLLLQNYFLHQSTVKGKYILSSYRITKNKYGYFYLPEMGNSLHLRSIECREIFKTQYHAFNIIPIVKLC